MHQKSSLPDLGTSNRRALRLPKTRDSVSSSNKRTRRTSAFSIRLALPRLYTESRVLSLRPKIINEIEAENNKSFLTKRNYLSTISSGISEGYFEKYS